MKTMNYFAAITFRTNQLDELGQAYLDKFEFISNPDILTRLWDIARKLFHEKCNDDWNQCNKIPDWAVNFLDGWTPFAPPGPGSLYSTLAYSAVSNDAHLRNLLERMEGRETNELTFAVFAEQAIVDKLSGLTSA
jgi:hypothetical protein